MSTDTRTRTEIRTETAEITEHQCPLCEEFHPPEEIVPAAFQLANDRVVELPLCTYCARSLTGREDIEAPPEASAETDPVTRLINGTARSQDDGSLKNTIRVLTILLGIGSVLGYAAAHISLLGNPLVFLGAVILLLLVVNG